MSGSSSIIFGITAIFIILYPNKLKNWEFSKPNSQILSNLKDAREAEPCLKDRRDPRLEKQSGGLFLAGWLHGRPQGRDGAGIKSANLGEEKTDSSICLGITPLLRIFYALEKKFDRKLKEKAHFWNRVKLFRLIPLSCVKNA